MLVFVAYKEVTLSTGLLMSCSLSFNIFLKLHLTGEGAGETNIFFNRENITISTFRCIQVTITWVSLTLKECTVQYIQLFLNLTAGYLGRPKRQRVLEKERHREREGKIVDACGSCVFC